MKNLFLLPTDKPTRLFTADSEIRLAGYPKTTFKTGKNIYITSDEEIKEGDWYLYTDILGKLHIYKYLDKGVRKGYDGQKIILTTDQDLIKEGVQAIDDEFLEWFVKNPSCEEVEVEKIEGRYVDYNGNIHNPISYKIIIPKEELYNEIQQKSLNSNKHFVNNKSDSELNNLIVEFDNYDSEKHNKDVIMELQKDPLLKEFDDKVNEKKSFLKQKQQIL